jgi:hypothetical protein
MTLTMETMVITGTIGRETERYFVYLSAFEVYQLRKNPGGENFGMSFVKQTRFGSWKLTYT